MRRGRTERGSATIEHLILLPALFAVLFLGMQAALFFHARSVAIAAAQEGARTAAGEAAHDGDGVRAANAFLTDAGNDALTGTTVSISRTVGSVTVVVEGHSLSVLPGWSPTVRQSATVQIERLTSP